MKQSQRITPALRAHQLATASATSIHLVATVIARRKRAVRAAPGMALREHKPTGGTKVFFGDFLSPDKKLPAAQQRKLCPPRHKHQRRKAGFQLPPE
jgi:hypothetical protein